MVEAERVCELMADAERVWELVTDSFNTFSKNSFTL
jgi:hypothetical protein